MSISHDPLTPPDTTGYAMTDNGKLIARDEIWFCCGDLVRYEDGVLVETIKYNAFASFHKEAVVRLQDVDVALREQAGEIERLQGELELQIGTFELIDALRAEVAALTP